MDNKMHRNSKLSKRAKLYLANGIFFVFLVIFALVWTGMSRQLDLVIYLIILCMFVFFSLIVYYLSIIADAVSGKATEREAEEQERLQKK